MNKNGKYIIIDLFEIVHCDRKLQYCKRHFQNYSSIDANIIRCFDKRLKHVLEYSVKKLFE